VGHRTRRDSKPMAWREHWVRSRHKVGAGCAARGVSARAKRSKRPPSRTRVTEPNETHPRPTNLERTKLSVEANGTDRFVVRPAGRPSAAGTVGATL
jgi:hypothetical protein